MAEKRQLAFKNDAIFRFETLAKCASDAHGIFLHCPLSMQLFDMGQDVPPVLVQRNREKEASAMGLA